MRENRQGLLCGVAAHNLNVGSLVEEGTQSWCSLILWCTDAHCADGHCSRQELPPKRKGDMCRCEPTELGKRDGLIDDNLLRDGTNCGSP